MKNELQNILQKKMNRKEFLQYVGSALLMVLGVSSLLKALSVGQHSQDATSGYGESLYGGKRQ